AIAQRSSLCQLLLRGLLDNTLELLKSADRLLKTYRVTDLNRAGQCFLGLHRLERFEVPEVRAIKRIGAFGLGDNNAWQFRNQSQLLHHEQARAERRNIAQVPTGDNDNIG